MDYYVQYFFKNQTVDAYKKHMNDIKGTISSHTNNFSIEVANMNMSDVVKKQNDKDYMNGKEVEYTENGIRILLPLKEFWRDIKSYIPKTITTLEIPFSLIENDLSSLKIFPNLDTLVLNDYVGFNNEHIKKIQQSTNIKKVITKSLYQYRDCYKEKGFFSLESDAMYYNDLLIQKSKEKDNNKMLLNDISINAYDLNPDVIEKLYSLNTDKITTVNINTSNGGLYKIKFIDDNSLDIYVNSNDVSDVNKFYNYLSNKGYKINSICYNVSKLNYLNIDLSLYESIASKTNLTFDYGTPISANYDEFKGLVESLKWYRGIINSSNLSPTEKVMFAFDIMKTFAYNESQSITTDSRNPHKIIETGNIVCVGYSQMLKQILNKMDDNIKIGDLSVECFDENGLSRGGHERNCVQIDDEKYNIHGIYALDATWDSFKEEGTSILGNDYTALDLYRYFLVPTSDYKKMFPNDSVPDLFKFKEENVHLLKEYNYAFDGIWSYGTESDTIKKEKEDKIIKYLNSSRISLATFNQMLYNVRLAEGYNKQQAQYEVEKVDKMNKYLISNMSNSNESISFFDEDKTKKGR